MNNYHFGRLNRGVHTSMHRSVWMDRTPVLHCSEPNEMTTNRPPLPLEALAAAASTPLSRRTLLAGAAAIAGGLLFAPAAARAADAPLEAAASFEAPAAILRAVAGPRARVATIIAAGSEPHGFEPSIRDLKRLAHASLFVWNGLGMEPWAAAAAKASGNSKLVARALAEGIDIDAAFPKRTEKSAQDSGTVRDPHLWLAPAGARVLARAAAEALSAADPAGRAAYEENLAAFEAELQKLSQRFEDELQHARRRVFFCGHASFGWLCREFGIEQRAASGVFAEGEPSPRRLAQLIDECRALGVKTVFAEAGESSAVLDTLAEEADARVVPLFTMETAENGQPYLDRLAANLNAIAASLCE